ELPQCSEFEVEEFECGSSGNSSGGRQCSVEFSDPDNRTWAALSRDGICRCLYDGITYCQCEHAGMTESGCNSCCPRLSDADFGFLASISRSPALWYGEWHDSDVPFFGGARRCAAGSAGGPSRRLPRRP